MQGAWYLYGDAITCVVMEGNPCSDDGCCLDWTSIVDSSHESWGCGVALELSASGGETSTRNACAGSATGFTITVTGSSAPNPIRIGFTQLADTTDKVSPFTEVDGPGTWNVAFTDASCPGNWATDKGCTPTEVAKSYDLQVQFPGGDAAGSGTICSTSLTPIL